MKNENIYYVKIYLSHTLQEIKYVLHCKIDLKLLAFQTNRQKN
jgi:hypothetical protein